MPKKSKATEPEAQPVAAASEAAKEQPRGAKTAAIKAALKSHKNASPKEIAELLTAQGTETTAAQVSNVKFLLSRKKRAKAAPAPAPKSVAAPAIPKDAVSISLLQKAKKLAARFGSIKEAKAAMDAWAQLMD